MYLSANQIIHNYSISGPTLNCGDSDDRKSKVNSNGDSHVKCRVKKKYICKLIGTIKKARPLSIPNTYSPL